MFAGGVQTGHLKMMYIVILSPSASGLSFWFRSLVFRNKSPPVEFNQLDNGQIHHFTISI
jgi:hypothetical protein